ncbi:MAG: metallophosphoesterase [bacterium]|nr:metallophosphoesterase [bacterium]
MKKLKIHKRVAFLSDIHLPFEHSNLLKASLEIIKEEKADTIVLGGDIVDFYNVASWTIDKTALKISEELDYVSEFLSQLRKMFPKQEIIFIEGNHEERFLKFIYKRADIFAPLLKRELSIQNILQLDKFNIHYKNEPFPIGKLFFLHGHEKKSQGQIVHIALTILRWLNRSFICGHFHRFNTFIQKEVEKSVKGGFTNGTFLNIKKMPTPYEKIDTNQLGFSMIYYHNEHFFVKPIMFIPHKQKFVAFYNDSVISI